MTAAQREELEELEEAAANARATANHKSTPADRVPRLLSLAADWGAQARTIMRLTGQDRLRSSAEAAAERPLPHGSVLAYNHGCRCDRCCESNRVRCTRIRNTHRDARILVDGVLVNPDATHGTIAGYTHHCCRCAPCAQARRDYVKPKKSA